MIFACQFAETKCCSVLPFDALQRAAAKSATRNAKENPVDFRSLACSSRCGKLNEPKSLSVLFEQTVETSERTYQN